MSDNDYCSLYSKGLRIMSFLVMALISEAVIGLKTTTCTITLLPNDFLFSYQAAFTKFFTCMKDFSPQEYRNRK
ncbi:MAG: hypothetical protein J6Z01_00965 [Bacteroidales bacterium]|nr:hypothetical protein [Bacteroidales bacterium]